MSMVNEQIGNLALGDNICLTVSFLLVMISTFLAVFFVIVLIAIEKKNKSLAGVLENEALSLWQQSENEFPIGTRVMVEYIDKSDEEHIIKYGDKGTVEGYDDMGHLFVRFDNQLNIRINPKRDFIHKLKKEEDLG